MGAGIAEVCARPGLKVRVAEMMPGHWRAGAAACTTRCPMPRSAALDTTAERDATLERLTFS
jgi:3-hydroxybutyryl-CoA dehydrogenase